MKIFHNISEVSKMLDEPQHVLRYWEGQHPKFISPTKRPGGRRFYRQRDIANLRIIQRFVREWFMGHKGINKILNEQKNQT